MLVSLDEDDVIVNKQAFDQLLDRLLGVGIPEQDAGVIRDEEHLFCTRITQ